jgi:hypothetical protein
MDKFLLGENPMRSGDSGLWVIHLLSPQAHIQCIEGKIETPGTCRHYVYINSDNVAEEWTLFMHYISIATLTDAEYDHLLDRAWRWFRSYLEFEDNNIDENERSKDN